jgi:hypothetical protein
MVRSGLAGALLAVNFNRLCRLLLFVRGISSGLVGLLGGRYEMGGRSCGLVVHWSGVVDWGSSVVHGSWVVRGHLVMHGGGVSGSCSSFASAEL